jgi:hypothetical protein
LCWRQPVCRDWFCKDREVDLCNDFGSVGVYRERAHATVADERTMVWEKHESNA